LKDEIVHGRYFINPAGDQGEIFSLYHFLYLSISVHFHSPIKYEKNRKKKTQAMFMAIFTHLENYYLDKAETCG